MNLCLCQKGLNSTLFLKRPLVLLNSIEISSYIQTLTLKAISKKLLINYFNIIKNAYWIRRLRSLSGFHARPYGKPTSECLIRILFYTVNNTYIRRSDPRGIVSSFETLDLVADQSSAREFDLRVEISKVKNL